MDNLVKIHKCHVRWSPTRLVDLPWSTLSPTAEDLGRRIHRDSMATLAQRIYEILLHVPISYQSYDWRNTSVAPLRVEVYFWSNELLAHETFDLNSRKDCISLIYPLKTYSPRTSVYASLLCGSQHWNQNALGDPREPGRAINKGRRGVEEGVKGVDLDIKRSQIVSRTRCFFKSFPLLSLLRVVCRSGSASNGFILFLF